MNIHYDIFIYSYIRIGCQEKRMRIIVGEDKLLTQDSNLLFTPITPIKRRIHPFQEDNSSPGT